MNILLTGVAEQRKEARAMNIRLATAADIAGIQQVGQICWPETYTAIAPLGYIESGLAQWWSSAFIGNAIGEPGSFILVAEAADGIVGTTHFALRDPNRAVMWKFYVLPEWRGRGVGRQLFATALALLPPTVDTIDTEYLSTNQRAAAVYRALGFTYDRTMDETFQDHAISYTWVKRQR